MRNKTKLTISRIYELIKKNPRKYGFLISILKELENSNSIKSNSLRYKRVFNDN